MIRVIIKLFLSLCILHAGFIYACGDNSNTLVQGPFRDSAFDNGYICFQKTSDNRDIEFFLQYMTKQGVYNALVDTYYYSDAPVELMSVFFAPVKDERNVIVLIRWNVNYEEKGIKYPYYYEIKTYNKNKEGLYKLNVYQDNESEFTGYQSIKNGKVIQYPLNNAEKIKAFLKEKYKVD